MEGVTADCGHRDLADRLAVHVDEVRACIRAAMGSTLDLRRVIGHVRQLLKGRTTSGAERLQPLRGMSLEPGDHRRPTNIATEAIE